MWATARIVETLLDFEVIISANVCASSGGFGWGAIPKACAVSVVRIPAFRGFVIAITIMEKSTHAIAVASGMCRRSIGIALPLNVVCAAVVLGVVAETVLVVTSNVVASVAG